MSPMVRIAWGTAAVATMVWACREPAPIEPEPEVQEALVPLYSPFVVEVGGQAPFRTISFKQVGTFRSEADRVLLFEALAESLSRDLTDASFEASLSYAPEVAAPSAHLACGSAHIYVDFWETQSDGYGFSLWSGCRDDSRFAHHELAPGEMPHTDDLATRMEHFTKPIRDALVRAIDVDCFEASC